MTTLIVFAAVVILVLVARSSWWRGKIRMIEGAWGFIRLYPNIGWKFGSKHWCRHYGRKAH